MSDSLYDETAAAAAASVIRAYSTSFGLATTLLGPRVRGHVRNVYALVRVADEIVDGAADAAGVPLDEQRRVLDQLEDETYAAIARGFSANLVVHAFARTSRECGIARVRIEPFFASMRTDLERAEHDDASHDDYVYGSAEVVGLMCLQVFVNAGSVSPRDPDPQLVSGARRLGAAFQDINFLRDHADDAGRLGRDYLGVGVGAARRAEVLARIDADLDAAESTIPLLPADCRVAVATAHGLFASLADRLHRTEDIDTRVRVPNPVKAAIAVRAAVAHRTLLPARRPAPSRRSPA
ncbi:phytoene/squalene synthase family protein [Microbacterium sp. NPDC091382]|uniref:phytoene/squalene synthase family protein n=1 Tax=Microbacterium sp. NPDC091382 TaxID=3364210 RepID=UPI00380A9256